MGRKPTTSKKVFEFLKKEKRATVSMIAKAVGISPMRAWHILNLMVLKGQAKKLDWGLYEIVEKNGEVMCNEMEENKTGKNKTD